jgi:hypothetical protein
MVVMMAPARAGGSSCVLKGGNSWARWLWENGIVGSVLVMAGFAVAGEWGLGNRMVRGRALSSNSGVSIHQACTCMGMDSMRWHGNRGARPFGLIYVACIFSMNQVDCVQELSTCSASKQECLPPANRTGGDKPGLR